MATTRRIGLDIGTFAVRAAQVRVDKERPVLERFAQVTLPTGAVADGEIADPEAVAQAIRRLWSEGGFAEREVVLGLQSPRVFVRQIDLPALDDEDMASALRFEAQDLMPIPLEDALLDFEIIDRFVGEEEEERCNVLVAACPAELVDRQLEVLRLAGLTATAVDLGPFALVRSLGTVSAEQTGEAEAIVSVGAGLTTVVVHANGSPRFARVLAAGGDDVTNAVAAALEVDFDEAEGAKRDALAGTDDGSLAPVRRAVSESIAPIVEEIRGSLDYHIAQTEITPVKRVLITGGSSALAGVAEKLRRELNVPVELGKLLSRIDVGDVGLAQEVIDGAEALLAEPVGLAMSPRPVKNGPRRISLLPEHASAGRARRRQKLVAAAAVAALIVALMAVWGVRFSQLATERSAADDAEQRLTVANSEIARLQEVENLERRLKAHRKDTTELLAADVDWRGVLVQIGNNTPDDVWLTALSASNGTPGTFTATAGGIDQKAPAHWLAAMRQVPALEGLWIPASSRALEGDGNVTFSITGALSSATTSDRAARRTGEVG